MKRKITILDALAIGGAVVRSIGRIRAEIEAAKDPHTPGGVKVTPPEALDAVLRGLLDVAPLVFEKATGEPMPDDLDLLDALSEL